ncbi:zincin-like metallopeptidase domain-containing protein [Sphingopyxis bauzanensis]|uniref:zincin-like metallopeptidase domain-containing protein n=1 Tax=Sphingopyxis bauzanensis TaxID=651663 RepID=UPI00267EED65|nr:zincin-like metallopeptidase domain-containing protein [Sphingopyxis bauzanensis]
MTPSYHAQRPVNGLYAEVTGRNIAELGIVPTVRHSDYIGPWLVLLEDDARAIFRAASQAGKAADYSLAFRAGEGEEKGAGQ